MIVWLIIGAVGIVTLFAASRERRLIRAIRRTPTVACAEVTSAGHVTCEIVGIAEPGPDGALRAPLTGTPCVWYRVLVFGRARQRYGAKLPRLPRPLLDSASAQIFGVRDGSGRAWVAPRGGTMRVGAPAVKQDEHAAGSASGGLAERARPLLGPGARLVPGKRYRYHEWHIAEGAPIYVLGGAARYRPDGPLLEKPARDGPLLIATGSEAELTARMRRAMWGAYGLGLSATVAGFGVAIAGLLGKVGG